MKWDHYAKRALLNIAGRNERGQAWHIDASAKSVEKLLAAGYVERGRETRPGFCIWITAAGLAALREHQERRG